jgi:phosphopantothenoylcysteine decarboxylase/phosphopantothenate--cysteine ligase
VPTRSSLNFVGKATWEALSGREVPDNLWNNVHSVPHISLARRSAHLIIAPTTADLLARIAAGSADDLLTNIVLASKAPLVLVPAMHPEMWGNAAVQSNVALIRSRGHLVIEPDSGRLTGTDEGPGRFPTSERIIQESQTFWNEKSDLSGRRVLVSAGGTREAIDPVRYIGNRSSGKQGYAIAEAAAARGARVTLVSANVSLPDIPGVETIYVESALEMEKALSTNFSESDILVMAAAGADARVANPSETKISKESLNQIALVENSDILASLAASRRAGQVLIAFAAETGAHGRERALAKLTKKKVDILFHNDVSDGAIFGADETQGEFLLADGSHIETGLISKDTLADQLLDHAINKLG